MSRFQVILQYLPQVQHEDYAMQQLAVAGMLPGTWEELSGEAADPVEERADAAKIREFQSDISSLRHRSSSIAAKKEKGLSHG